MNINQRAIIAGRRIGKQRYTIFLLRELKMEKLKIKKKCCNQCLFTKRKIVSEERKKELLATIEKEDSHFICHKATIENKNHVCRGFYENKTSNFIRVSERLNMISFVD